MSVTVVFIVCLLIAIFGGWYFKINAGLLATIFAFFIGINFIDLSASQVIALWPTKLFMTILFITFFFGFSMSNGTLDGIAKRTIWVARNIPPLFPIFLYLLTVLLASLGMSPYSIFTFMAPLIMAIAKKSNMHNMVAAMVIISGTMVGAYSTHSGQFGITMVNTLTTHGYSPTEVIEIANHMWLNMAISHGTVFLLIYFIFKGYKIKFPEMEKPEPFNKKQRITVSIIGFIFAWMLVPAVLNTFFPNVPLLISLIKSNDILVVAPVGIVLCVLFKVADEKQAMTKIPMSALLLVCGVSTLISIGMKAGVVEQLSAWAAANISGKIAPYFFAISAGTMSYFASTVNVVVPSLGMLVAGVSSSTGIPATLLYSYLNTASSFSGFSPFSSGGAISLSGVSDEEDRNTLYKTLLIFPTVAIAIFLIMIVLGLVF